MKYCISSRCSVKYLNKVDEIKVQWRDRESILDLANQYATATFILECPEDISQEIDNIDMWYKGAAGRLICCLRSLDLAPALKERGIDFYFGYPIENFYELNALKDAGVCYVRLGAGLFFQMDAVKKYEIPVRVVPNVAYHTYLPFKSGIPGTWIRPEDIPSYEKENYIHIVEFEDCDTTKEEALLRIYGLGQGWGGPLNELFTNFESDARGCLINEDFVEARFNCKQRCMENGHCHYCYRALKLADKSMWERVKAHLQESEEKIEK